jgi:hypothetical protein
MSYNRQRFEITQPSGLVKDLSPYEMAPNLWSNGCNVNFRRGRTNAYVASSNPYPALTLAGKPTFLQWYNENGTNFWLYCAKTVDSSIVAITSGATSNTLGSGFLNTRNADWAGSDFNSVIVLNNRNNIPQVVRTIGTAPFKEIVDMPNWGTVTSGGVTTNNVAPWGVASRCEVIRTYKNYMMIMDCYDQTGQRYPNMVRWSGPAQLGGTPNSFDPSVVGQQAGLYALADTPGRVVDGLTLGDYFVVYKSDAVWLMQFIGGQFTMSFRKLFGGDSGILSKNCVAEFQGKHFVLSPSSCYVHNGSSKEDVMDGWVKDEFFNTVSPAHVADTKVVADNNNNEMLIYYISRTAASDAEIAEVEPYADKALVWNWVEAKWTCRDLNGIAHIAEGYIVPNTAGVDDWESDDQAWNLDPTTWNGQTNFSTLLEGLLMASYEGSKFEALEYPEGSDPYAPLAFVERIGLDFEQDRQFKMLERVVPHIKGVLPVTISIYVSDIQTSFPSVAQVVVFDPLTDVDVDVHCSGRYVGLRFECAGAFQLDGYTLEGQFVGSF